MARYARVEAGVAVELIDTGDYAITQLYAPAFVASMVQVAEGMEVEIGAPITDILKEIAPPRFTQSAVVPQVAMAEDEAPQATERDWRQSSISASDWLMNRHRDEQELGRGTTLTAQQYLTLLEYRQALRDWPDSSQFPSTITRPSAPVWLLGVID